MEPFEEHTMIAKECEWAIKYELEKRGELEVAQKRYNEAQFRKRIIVQAMADFLAGNPEFAVGRGD